MDPEIMILGGISPSNCSGTESMNEVNTSSAAERMRRHRLRRRNGLRCLIIELRETEITRLIRDGFLAAEARDDSSAVTRAFLRFSRLHVGSKRVTRNQRLLNRGFPTGRPVATCPRVRKKPLKNRLLGSQKRLAFFSLLHAYQNLYFGTAL